MEPAEHVVEILPYGFRILVPDGGPLMAAALAQGYRWPSVCNGEAACGVCMVIVDEGLDHAGAIGRDEEVRLTYIGKRAEPRARLACQLRVHGAMRLIKRGVKAPQPAAPADARGEQG